MSAVLRSFKPCPSPVQISTSELSCATCISAEGTHATTEGLSTCWASGNERGGQWQKHFPQRSEKNHLCLDHFSVLCNVEQLWRKPHCPLSPITRVSTEEMGDESSSLCSGGRNKTDTVCLPTAWVLRLYVYWGWSCCLLVIPRWLGCKAPAALVRSVGRPDTQLWSWGSLQVHPKVIFFLVCRETRPSWVMKPRKRCADSCSARPFKMASMPPAPQSPSVSFWLCVSKGQRAMKGRI